MFKFHNQLIIIIDIDKFYIFIFKTFIINIFIIVKKSIQIFQNM